MILQQGEIHQRKLMNNIDHVFIVGLGRTGSTLTRQILNSSDCIGIGGESHYLGDLPNLGNQTRRSVRHQLLQIGDFSSDEGTIKIVDYLFTIQGRHLAFWNFFTRKVDHDQFMQKMLEMSSAERERGLFELAMQIHAGGRFIRGEKTPAHIFFVPQLLEWFPNAKVIHTFRDPRAVYVSRNRKAENKASVYGGAPLRRLGAAFQLASSFHVLALWRKVVRLHWQLQEQYPSQYMLLKYEDLVINPESTLDKLCHFLEIPRYDSMLKQTVVNSSYLPDGVEGFDAGSINRWRKHMDPLLQRWFKLWLGPKLQEYGYES